MKSLGRHIALFALAGLAFGAGDTRLIDAVKAQDGDPRWSGSSALIGAVVSGQASIVQYPVDHGANVNAKTNLGWTPLMVAEGVFFANAKNEFPAAAEILRKARANPAGERKNNP